jgi:prephenate dehydrogenase
MRLSEATVAIAGLGLMGGSLAMALDGKCKRRIGIARSQETCLRALAGHVVDHATTDLHAGAGDADIVVLATPVRTILSMLGEIGPYLRPGTLVTDLGSTKVDIIEAMNRLPDQILAVGGHPMCGKERGGLGEAEAGIFEGATYVLTPTSHTTESAMSLATEIVHAIGARVLILDAQRHDSAAAHASHMPYLVAAALIHSAAGAGVRDPVVSALAASGFRDTTRLASSEVPMMLDILLTNRQAVEEALTLMEKSLAEAKLLLGDSVALEEWMRAAQCSRNEMFA